MQTALVYLCLSLLSTALSTPVPLPLPPPGRVAGNCVGQHRILLKGCNAKHGFYIFKYVYSFSTRRNQTQIKKEEADGQSTIPIRQLDKDNAQSGPAEDRAAPKQDDNISSDATQHRPSPKPENRSIVGTGGHGHSPRPGASTRARSGVGTTASTPASSEGSGDLDLVIDLGDVPVLPQGRRAGEATVGNRSAVRSEDRDDGAPRGVPVEWPTTTGRERAPVTAGAGDDSSGEATVHGQEQGSVVQGTGMGGSALASVTENREDVQVDTKGVDEYAFIPDSGSVTVTHGELGNTSFTQISPDKDDEVNIFIGRASIHVGEQESTQPSVTVDSEDDSIPTAGTSSTLPRLGFTSAHGGDGDDDDDIPARRQPEGLATTATPIQWDSITSSHGDDHPTRGDEDGVTTAGDGEGPVALGNSDDKVRSEGQRFQGRPSLLPVTTIHPGDDDKAAATVPAKGASIHLGTTVTSPRVSEEDCTTAKGTASGPTEGESAMVGRGGSGEEKPATSQPHREGQPGAGVRVQLGGAGLDTTTKTYKVPSPRGKAGSRVSSETPLAAGGRGGNAGGQLHTTKTEGSPPSQAGRASGGGAAGKGQQWGQGGKAGAAMGGAGGGRLPGHRGSRPGAGAAGMLAALSRSRQVDRVKHADELHLRERAFYSLGGAGGGPLGPHTGLRSADSSQSSEGEQGSLSDSHQTGLQPSGWGAPGHPHGHWSQGTF